MPAVTKDSLVQALAKMPADAILIVGQRPVSAVSLTSGWLFEGYFGKAFQAGGQGGKGAVRARAIRFATAEGENPPRLTRDDLLSAIAAMPDDAVIVVNDATVEGVVVERGWLAPAFGRLRYSEEKPGEKARESVRAIRFTALTEDSLGEVYASPV